MGADLAQRIQSTLEKHIGALQVRELSPIPGGACQELYQLTIEQEGGPRRLVLRSDARQSLPGSVSREVEFAVIGAAVESGVPTPEARWFSRDLVREGAGAWFMDWLEGEATGSRVVRGEKLARARQVLPEQLAGALAAIHRVRPGSRPDLPLEGAGLDPAERELGWLRQSLDQLPSPQPALELGLRWLSRHRPRPGEITLVHGDFRTGNFLVGEQGLVAVLDWEFTRWGDPMEDIAWLCVRDWRFGQLSLPAGGLATRERFYRAYAETSGRPVDPARVHWWEVAGNLRWAAGAVYQGLRYLSGQSPDLELLAIPRRVSEMAWEALRLIETGPPSLPRLEA